MKLMTELTENVEFITEATESGKKNFYIQGPFLAAEQPNKNGRSYPMGVMEAAVNKYMTKITEGRAFGELGHPAGPQINLDRVSHIITELKRDGNNFIGKARLAETPNGNIARGIMESGGKLGVSSRGLGTLKQKGSIMEVQSDFHLATAADIVADPSGPGCFINGIMENASWVYNADSGEWYQETLHETKKMLHGLTLEQIEEKKLAIFESFIRKFS